MKLKLTEELKYYKKSMHVKKPKKCEGWMNLCTKISSGIEWISDVG